MIVETIFNWFVNGVITFFALLPTVDGDVFNSWTEIKEILMNILQGVSLILPIEELLPLVAFQGALWTFRLVFAIILRIKSFIPLLGGT